MVCGFGLVKATYGDGLPTAVRFFDASTGGVTHGRGHLPCDGVVAAEVLVQLGVVAFAELAASWSARAEEVAHFGGAGCSGGCGENDGRELHCVENGGLCF